MSITPNAAPKPAFDNIVSADHESKDRVADHQVTGQQPAILGLDYIDPDDNAAVNDRAIAWHPSDGVVTLCWHWGAPDIGPGYENSKKDFDLVAASSLARPKQRPASWPGPRRAAMAQMGPMLHGDVWRTE